MEVHGTEPIRTTGLARRIQARNMALRGYVSKIIQLETGMSYKQVRRIYDELEREGRTIQRKSRACRGGASIIHNSDKKIQASMVMQLYRNIGGDAVLDSIHIDALERAHKMYCALWLELLGAAASQPADLDITDCWCLAAELRDDEAMFEHCQHCDTTYFTSVNQRTCVSCPYCQEQKKHKRHEDERPRATQ